MVPRLLPIGPLLLFMQGNVHQHWDGSQSRCYCTESHKKNLLASFTNFCGSFLWIFVACFMFIKILVLCLSVRYTLTNFVAYFTSFCSPRYKFFVVVYKWISWPTFTNFQVKKTALDMNYVAHFYNFFGVLHGFLWFKIRILWLIFMKFCGNLRDFVT